MCWLATFPPARCIPSECYSDEPGAINVLLMFNHYFKYY
ncbi:hypothetical protein BN135_3288 [Cronobacter muytjensii 530]